VLKLSVGVTRNADLLEIEGLCTRGSRPGRTFGESVGGIFEMGSSDWFDTTTSIPDPTLSLTECLGLPGCRKQAKSAEWNQDPDRREDARLPLRGQIPSFEIT